MTEKVVGEPVPVGLAPSFGFGDRIGLSTVGHIAALRRAGLAGRVVPIFAQQSIRELARTGRGPEEVMAAAKAGVEAAGWEHPWGADGDHLKTEEDVERMVRAGYTFFTADPSEYVDEQAGPVGGSAVQSAFDAVCGNCEVDGEAYLERYAGGVHEVGDVRVEVDIEEAMRVAMTYLPAIGQVIRLYGWVADRWEGEAAFDFEVSVDETETATSRSAHLIVASELKRAGVRFTSLAPRFVGSFEKAVDYRGDVGAFEADLKRHAAIARAMGPYKLSVHSGSDKFAIYPLLADHAGELLHVKTAGTSYLEALRLMARYRPAMFREVVELAAGQFEQARATYHLSTELDRVDRPEDVGDGDLEAAYLVSPGADDARQVLHVAFGSVLGDGRFGPALRELMVAHAEEHAEDLVRHFAGHLVAFGG